MTPADELDDDTVTRLLAEDARAASARYASQGLSAMLPRRPAEAALRPNTRFLKNLVRDADSHNAALNRKERSEHRARLRRLNDSSSLRDRHSAGEEHRKGQRLDGRGHREGDDDSQRERGHRHKRRRRNFSSESPGSRSPSPHQKHLPSSRYLDKHRIHDDDHLERNHKHRHKRRNSAYQMSRSRSPSRHRDRHRPSSSIVKDRTHDRRPHRPKKASGDYDSASQSDPLEDLVGPLPPPSPPLHNRGRGAQKQSISAIDSHFAANYDPALDILHHQDPEDGSAQQQQEQEDWDMALEAFRDRQKWKQKHAERMREAGFGDEEIKKWQDSSTSGKEKSAASLRWGKAGDAREWDQGKQSV